MKRGCLEPAVLRKLLSKTRPGTPLPLPRPPKKKHPQPTRKRLLIKSPSPVRCPRNRFPGPSPSVNPCIGPHAKDSHPKPASDCVLTPSRARISSPLATGQGTTTAPRSTPECDLRDQRCAKNHQEPSQNKQEHHSPTKRNAVACPRNGPGLPPTGPSPGANPPIYPSSLPLASGNPLSNIFPTSHEFFSFFCLRV